MRNLSKTVKILIINVVINLEKLFKGALRFLYLQNIPHFYTPNSD